MLQQEARTEEPSIAAGSQSAASTPLGHHHNHRTVVLQYEAPTDRSDQPMQQFCRTAHNHQIGVLSPGHFGQGT